MSTDLRSRLRDPWQVAPLLIAVIGLLAVLFPKPQQAPEETDPARIRTPPAGMTLALLSEPLSVNCQQADQPLKACALLGAEGEQIYHLEVSWSLAELKQAHRGKTFVIEGVRLDLLENHREQYTGPIQISAREALLAVGGRVDNRTLRAPLEAVAPALDAEVTRWLNDPAASATGRLRIAADPASRSSIDEYTPQLSFFYRAE